MRVDIVLPDLGEDAVQDVTVSAWLAKKGARLSEGDDLLEITTDKAAFCVPCPKDGTLAELSVGEGDVIHVGDVVGALEV
jgi:pyruvate/2-oxoglutarate dehydrogenase complex dihydrolipoamide acyltransferase (E2) component